MQRCCVSASNKSTHFEDSKRNIDDELSRLEDVRTQLDWLIDQLGIYLRRLDGFCKHLDKPPSDFFQSSLYCNIQVASAHIERILNEQGRINDSWTGLIESLSALSDAESIKRCNSYFQTICESTNS